jgi:hypothetical protein
VNVSDDWEEDLRRSAETFVMVWPQIRKGCGCSVGGLVPIENVNRGQLNALDLTAGIDYMAPAMTGGLVSIAARVQRPPHHYASFTIRLSRRTGTPTEWVKRVRSFKYDEVLPTLTVQIYVDGKENLVGYGVVKTRALLSHLLAGPEYPGYNFTIKDVKDGNKLMAVWWLWMRREGVAVTTHGEERLRGPHNPWHVPMDTPCLRCQHQIACHVAGRLLASWQDRGWAIYDRRWNDASGACATKGCDCPSAYCPRFSEVASTVKLCPVCNYRLDPVAGDIHQSCEYDTRRGAPA